MARHAICDLRLFNFLKYFIYSFLAVLGLHCCTWAFSSCGKQSTLQVGCTSFSSCGAQALECKASVVAMHGLRFVILGLSCPAACEILVPGPGIEPVSPALEGRLQTTGPSGMSQAFVYHLLRGLPLPPYLK